MEPLISIVDDDKSVRDALRRMLKSQGFATAVFSSAQQFLRFPRFSDTSCLIIDVRMPGITGLALHNYLMSTGWRIPTILMTASPTQSEQRRAVAGGAASYLAKPLSAEVLLDTIRRTLEGGGRADRGQPPGGNTHSEELS